MIRRLVLASLFPLVAAGALAAGPLDGTWKAVKTGSGPDTTFRFTGNRIAVRMQGPMAPGKVGAIDVTGTYTLQGDRLTLKFTDAKMDESLMGAADRKKFATPQGRATIRQRFLANSPPPFRVKGLGTNRLRLANGKGPDTVLVRAR